MSSPFQTLKLLAALEESEPKEILANCFALTERGEVSRFDQTGSPHRVGVEGAALISTGIVLLPTQSVQGISSAEAYQWLTRPRFKPGQFLSKRRSGQKTIPLLFLIMALIGEFVLFINILSNGSATSIMAQTAIVTAPSGYYNPIGAPTISRATFKAFLAELHSPALTEAESMYSASVEEGADPALVLAFFEHESSGGNAGVASVTKSIGNIRCSSGYSCFATLGNGSFRLYSTWMEGTRDWVCLLKYYRDGRGLATLEEIIPTYAPAADHNNEAAYIAGVKNRVNQLREREK